VHGAGGLDEFAPAGVTEVAELRGTGAMGDVEMVRYRLTPRDFALEEGDPLELRGGDARFNAEIVRSVLGGARGAVRNVVVMTAAATLYVAGMAGLRDGARMAEAAIDEGRARDVLDHLVIASRERLEGEA